jgi:energy-coupling factor transporter transmembrane protein EcfT
LRRRQAAAVLLALTATTTLALLAPPLWVLLALVAAVTARTKGRRGLALFAAATFAFNILLFGLLGPGPELVRLSFLRIGQEGVQLGLVASLRLVAVAAGNLAWLDHVAMERLLDGLGLPARAAGTLGAIALCAQDVGHDARRLVDAARLDGEWPDGWWRRLRSGVPLFPPLLVCAVRRAETRREALRLAGQDLGPRWTPIVAVGALAIVGRLAFLALPNVALTYALVFLGGLLFGPRVGAAAGLLSMGLTDLLLTGLQPVSFVNAPAMAVLGLLGGALRRLDWGAQGRLQAWANRALAAAVGLAATLSFSVAADALSWALVPEYRALPGSLRLLVASGLAFNVIPGLVNAFLFAVAIPPTVRAWRAVSALAIPGAAAAAPGQAPQA